MKTAVGELLQRVGNLTVLARGPLAPVRQGGVDRDTMEPGGDAGIAAKGVELADNLKQDILGNVLRVGIIAQHAPRQVIDPRRVVAKDLLRRQRGSGIARRTIGNLPCMIHGPVSQAR